MKVFKEKIFLHKLIFLIFLFLFLFFLPISRLPYILMHSPIGAAIVIIIFISVLADILRIGLTKYIINDKGELIITFLNKPKFTERIAKIRYVTDFEESAWARGRKLLRKPKSKIHLVDGKAIPIFKELQDEKNESLIQVLKTRYNIQEKQDK